MPTFLATNSNCTKDPRVAVWGTLVVPTTCGPSVMALVGERVTTAGEIFTTKVAWRNSQYMLSAQVASEPCESRIQSLLTPRCWGTAASWPGNRS